MRRWIKWTLITAVLLIGLAWAAGALLRPWVEERLREELALRLGGGKVAHDVEPLDVHVSLWRGRAVVHDLQVIADTTIAPDRSHFSFTVPRFEVQVGLMALLRGKLDLQRIRLASPEIHIDAPEHLPHGQMGLSAVLQQVRGALSGYLSSIGVRDLLVEDATLIYTRPYQGRPWSTRLDGMELELRGLVLDKGGLEDPERLPVEEFRITCGPQRFITPDGHAHFAVQRLHVSHATRILAIEGLRVQREVPDGEGGTGDQREVEVASFLVSGFELEEADSGGVLVAHRMRIEAPRVQVQRGDRTKRTTTGRRPPWTQMISDVMPGARVDTLELVGGQVALATADDDSVGIDHIDVRLLHTTVSVDENGFNVGRPRSGSMQLRGLHMDNAAFHIGARHLAIDIVPRTLQMDTVVFLPKNDAVGGLQDMAAGQIRCTGLDVQGWLDTHAVDMDSLLVHAAEVRLPPLARRARAHVAIPDTDSAPPRIPLPALMARAGITTLRLGHVRADGSLELPAAARVAVNGRIGHFDLRSEGVRCPERAGEPHRDLYADRTDLALDDVLFHDTPARMDLRVAHMEVSTRDRRIHLRDLGLTKNGGTGVKVQAHELEVTGFDLPALLDRRGLRMRKLSLVRSDLVVDLPEAPAADAPAPSALMRSVTRHLQLDTLDIHSRSLIVRRGGPTIATVDSFYFHARDVRPDPVNSKPGHTAFLRNGVRYGGRRLKVHLPGMDLQASGGDVDLDAGHGEWRNITGTVQAAGRTIDLDIARINGRNFDPHFIRTTEVVELGSIAVQGARINVGPATEAGPRGTRNGHGASLFGRIHVGGVKLEGATVTMQTANDGSVRQVHMSEVDLLVGPVLHRLMPGHEVRTEIGPLTFTVGQGSGSTGPGGPDVQVEHLTAKVDAIRLHADGSRDVDGLEFASDALRWRMAKGTQAGSLASAHYDQDDRTLRVEGLHLAPVQGQEVFAAGQAYRTDALVVDVARLEAHGLDAKAGLRDKSWHVRSVVLTDPVLNDLRDHRLPVAPYRYKPLPPARLAGSGLRLRVDTIALRNGTVHYAERSEKGTGRVALNKLEGNVLGFGTANTGASPLSLDVHGTMQQNGRFHLLLGFLPHDPGNGFTYRLGLGGMEMKEFNSILEPSAHLRIERGRLDTLHLVAEANDSLAIGTMGMYYSGLHVALLGSGKDQGIKQTVGDWAANAVVRTNNRRQRARPPAAIYFERMTDRSVFHYLVKQTLSGIPGNVRLPDRKKQVRESTDTDLKERLQRDLQE